MDLVQLIQFKAIAECGSITAASEKLHISQPALSMMLRKLEGELGVSLFTRKKNRISLSFAGEIALTHVNQIQKQIFMMKDDLHRFMREENSIRVSFCSQGLGGYLFPLFVSEHPEIHLTISGLAEGESDADLLFDYYEDVIVTSRPIAREGIVCETFLRDEHYLSVSGEHPLAKRGINHILIDKNWNLPQIYYLNQVNDTFCQMFESFFRKNCPKTEIIPYTDYHAYMRKIQNKDVVTTTTGLVKKYRKDGPDHVAICIDNPELSIQYYLCYLEKNRERISPFLEWTKEIMEQQ